jgi:hypothetical protein
LQVIEEMGRNPRSGRGGHKLEVDRDQPILARDQVGRLEVPIQ